MKIEEKLSVKCSNKTQWKSLLNIIVKWGYNFYGADNIQHIQFDESTPYLIFNYSDDPFRIYRDNELESSYRGISYSEFIEMRDHNTDLNRIRKLLYED